MGKLNILVVEDELFIGLSIRKRLENIGLNVIMVVSSGDEAYQISAERVPDLILMDIRLEGNLDGLDTARTLWKNFSVPIIIVSGNIEYQNATEVTEEWCYGFAPKPLHELELESVVSTAINRIFHERYLKSPVYLESHQVYNPIKEWLLNNTDSTLESQLLNPESILRNNDRFLPMDTFQIFSNRENRDSNAVTIDIKDYLTHLAFLIWNKYNPNNYRMIQLNIDSESVALTESQALQVGTILSESLKNCIQYAFNQTTDNSHKRNTIDIKFGVSKSKGKFYYKIRDNGVGLNQDVIVYPSSNGDAHRDLSQGFGMKIIKGMTELLGSEFYLSGDQGTCIEIVFPINIYSEVR